jgi:hypothetical protein
MALVFCSPGLVSAPPEPAQPLLPASKQDADNAAFLIPAAKNSRLDDRPVGITVIPFNPDTKTAEVHPIRI